MPISRRVRHRAGVPRRGRAVLTESNDMNRDPTLGKPVEVPIGETGFPLGNQHVAVPILVRDRGTYATLPQRRKRGRRGTSGQRSVTQGRPDWFRCCPLISSATEGLESKRWLLSIGDPTAHGARDLDSSIENRTLRRIPHERALSIESRSSSRHRCRGHLIETHRFSSWEVSTHAGRMCFSFPGFNRHCVFACATIVYLPLIKPKWANPCTLHLGDTTYLKPGKSQGENRELVRI